MSDVIGSNGNDFLGFQGTMTHLTLSITNPFSSRTLLIDDDKLLNSSTYEGLAGIDTLLMSNNGDALFLEHQTTGVQTIKHIERIVAGEGGDVVHLASVVYVLNPVLVDGGGGDDIIWSNIGDDTLNGLNGDDIIDGGPGNDIVNGGNGLDQPGTGNDDLSGGAGADLLSGEDGDDIFYSFQDGLYALGALATNAFSGETADISGKTQSYDTFLGGSGFDSLVLTGAADVLLLDDAVNPRHSASSGARLTGIEQIDAGAGDDVVNLTSATYATGDILLRGGDGNDVLWAGNGNDTVYGDAGNDRIDAGIGNDTVHGGDGNDIIRGGPDSGSVTVHTDHHAFTQNVVFPHLVETVSIQHLVPPGTNALGVAAGDLSVEFATTAEISFLSTGAGYNNSLGFYRISADGTIGPVTMAFANVKDFDSGDHVTVNLPGAPDSEFGFFIVADGARQNNYAGLDIAHGSFSFVYDYGLGGQRAANVSDNGTHVSLIFTDANGHNTVIHGIDNGIYHTTERGGSVNLNPDHQNHVLSGNDATSPDDLYLGFEDLRGTGDADYNDVVFSVHVNDRVTETVNVAENDTLFGDAGNDTLYGGLGNDILIGGEGLDTLTGGQGSDRFVIDTIAGGADSITDFHWGQGGDILDISDILDNYDPAHDALSNFVHVVAHNGNAEVQINADGHGTDFATAAILVGAASVSLDDLVTGGNLAAA